MSNTNTRSFQPRLAPYLIITILSWIATGCGELQSIDTVSFESDASGLTSLNPTENGGGGGGGLGGSGEGGETTLPRPTPTPLPVELSDCQRQIKVAFEQKEAQKMAWYSSRGYPVPKAKQRSVLHFGAKSHMVLVVHGFVSDPSLQADMIQVLAQQGYSVMAPLLTGFGSSADAANASGINDWRGALNDAVAIAQMCPQKVSLLGHSFGGALIGTQLTGGAYAGIHRAVLLAPSFKTQAPFWLQTFNALLYFTDKLSAGELGDQVGIDLYSAFQLDRPAAGEEGYTFPIRAASTVTAYQDQTYLQTTGSTAVPTLVLLTEGDTIIRNDSAENFVNAHFTNANISYLENSELIVHSFQRRLINPFFDQMMAQILTTLGP